MKSLRLWVIPGLLAALGGIAWLTVSRLAHPNGSLLLSEKGAEWIRVDEPFSLFHRKVATRSTDFRRRFVLDSVPQAAKLRVLGFRSATLFVNGERVDSEAGDYDVTDLLHPGSNQLLVTVENDRGPPALLVRSGDLAVSTPGEWRARTPGSGWSLARVVSDRPPFPASREFPSARESLARTVGYLLGFFLAGALGSWLLGHHAHAARVRWLLMSAWVLLCANNIGKIPWDSGFDVWGHYQYIGFLLERGRIPIASDGWTTFHPPLFYLLAAIPAALAAGRLEPETTLLLLRVLPMLCGLAQIEIAYRSVRVAFPGRNDLQVIGTLFAGFLPMNVYMSQTVSNEPLSGCLTALMILCSFRLLVEQPRDSFRRSCGRLGFLLGLALLTKASAIVLLPVMLLLILHRAASLRLPLRERMLSPATFALVGAGVAGWYYVRNWLLFGTPFLGGWELGRGFDWWQDPGYRVFQDFFGFGEALRYPVFSSLIGFWDGVHSTLWLDGQQSVVKLGHGGPSWSHEFMSAMALVAIPLVIAGFAGALRTFAKPATPASSVGRFSLACLVSMLAAMLYVFASTAAYCAVKSSYALGLLPCIAVLVTSGFAWIPRNVLTRALVSGYLFSWFAFSYIAYFAM